MLEISFEMFCMSSCVVRCEIFRCIPTAHVQHAILGKPFRHHNYYLVTKETH